MDDINNAENNITTITNNDNVTEKSNDDNTCCICIDEIDNKKNILITECEHKYHFSCMLSYITKLTNDKKKLTCPKCRRNLNNNVVEEEDINHSSNIEDEMIDFFNNNNAIRSRSGRSTNLLIDDPYLIYDDVYDMGLLGCESRNELLVNAGQVVSNLSSTTSSLNLSISSSSLSSLESENDNFVIDTINTTYNTMTNPAINNLLTGSSLEDFVTVADLLARIHNENSIK